MARALALVLALSFSVALAHADPAGDAVAACASLSLAQQLSLMAGVGPLAGYSRNCPCAGICGRTTFRYDNGPQGFGDGSRPGSTTQFPASLAVAASFDPDLAGRYGTAMGEEFWAKGTNIQEGPGVNVARIQRCGRNFEYMSGEDPVLGSALLPRVVDGIQTSVMAIVKHFIGNTIEQNRGTINDLVDETLLMELYGPPFAAAVAGVDGRQAAGVMCAYNRVNGVYACENPMTLKTMLKGRYNFSGFVVSDWGATHSTSDSLRAGLDIEMPNGNYYTAAKLSAALAAGNTSTAAIADTCRRVLQGWFALSPDRRHPCGGGVCIDANVSTPAHKALAREVAAKSTVLLKNEGGLLPLGRGLSLALIGKDATAPYTAGQGSGGVVTNAVVSPLAALAAAGARVTYSDGSNATAAAAAAAAADVAIVFGHAESGEGHDRSTLALAGGTDALIPLVAAANPRTLVYMAVPGSTRTDWRASVPAILVTFLPGEQIGPALVDVLYGAVPPQGKLPVTFPLGENDLQLSPAQYPGVPGGGFPVQTNYSEGLLIGHRGYERMGLAPAYPFGHGLTYGSFTYSGLSVSGRDVSFTLTRSAGSLGCDTPQLYLGWPTAASDPRVPLKVLKAFEKVCAPSAQVTFTVTDAQVSNWDAASGAWAVTHGVYAVSVGSSSADIRLTGQLTV